MTREASRRRTLWQIALLSAGFFVLVAISVISVLLVNKARDDSRWVVHTIEVENQIWDAMQKLSPRQRAVIVQRYFLEMSEKEMAGEAGSAVGTVKWMLNAARERLRGLLERSER